MFSKKFKAERFRLANADGYRFCTLTASWCEEGYYVSNPDKVCEWCINYKHI